MRRKSLMCFLLFAVALGFISFPVNTSAQSRKDRKRAENLVVEGDTLYRQQNYDAAIVSYARALAVVPKYPLAHYNKGRAHFNLDQFDEAISEFGIAMEQGYDALTVLAIRWRAYFAKKQLDDAMNDIQKAKRAAPDNDYFYIAEGQIFHEQRNFQEAVDSYLRAMELGTKNTNVGYLLALSYNGLGNWQKQEEYAKQALQSGTNFPDMAWFLAGDAQQRLRKYEDAMRSYQNAKSVNPDLYGIFINLAETYRVLNRLKDAISTAEEGVRKYPNDSTLLINISWYYSLSNRNDAAIEYATRATTAAPNQYLGFTNLCRAYNDSNQLALAKQNCEKALQLQPGDGETNFYLGRTYQLMNDVDKAFEHYDLAVKGLEVFTKANPNYADGFYLLGNAYSVTEQNDNAVRAYLDSLEIAPLFARSRFNLGLIYIRENKIDKAREQVLALRDINAQLAKQLEDAINR
jgi:tetratricopeptide (TPR) repeat protein